MDAFVAGLAELLDAPLRVIDYHEHAIGSGADAQAVAARMGRHTVPDSGA